MTVSEKHALLAVHLFTFYVGTLFAHTHTTILDVTVGFDQTSYSITEGAAPLSVCTILTGVADREVMVTLTTMPISAQGRAAVSPQHIYLPFLPHLECGHGDLL